VQLPGWLQLQAVAALVIAAADARIASRPLRIVPAPEELPAWEQPLRALLDEAPATGTPLAIELSLQDGGRGAPRLLARLQRPGALAAAGSTAP
jgi:hypothetical protein